MYRLRINQQIVGYLSIDTNDQSFYSKDMYGWSSTPIEYTDKDVAFGYKDRLGRPLFSGDLCMHNKDTCVLIYQSKWDLYDVDLDQFIRIEPSIDQSKQLRWIGLLYSNLEMFDILKNKR